ncbi:hypothetical protein HT031_003234 [Scenedesmus sp. PABB004]|nr:hypothetical protein HT031_003234 [Scenedesmus sp. PABB004]
MATPQRSGDAGAGAGPAAEAAAAACRTGYVASGTSCACAPGWGSHVPGWPNATYPTLPPTCALFRPGKDKLYKEGTVFPPAGAGKGKCFCFACPPGYTSAGGRLSQADAACRAAPTLSLVATYTIDTSGVLCDAKVNAAVGAKLRVALKRAAKVDAQLVAADCPDPPAGVSGGAGPASHKLVLRLSYTGTDAQKRLKQFGGVARKINAPSSQTAGKCAFGVCNAVKQASRGAASVAVASAEVASTLSGPSPSPAPQQGCRDTGCESRACQTSKCDAASGKCSYSNLANGTACDDGAVSGQCASGTCVGLNANIEAAAQGVTEPVIFKARFAGGGAGVGTAVTLNGVRNGSDAGEVLGTLYDDGSRLHEDRFAGDGVFSNIILLTFAESDQPVYKAFYVSLQGAAGRSAPVGIAAVTTRIDTLLELFPTEQLVTTAQARVAELVDAGASPEAAIAAIYDLLIEYSVVGGGGRRRAAAAAAPQEAAASVNLTSILSRVDASTVTRVSERRVEFKTLEGFPCMVLALPEYGDRLSGGKCGDGGGARRRLLQLGPQPRARAAGTSARAVGGLAATIALQLQRDADAGAPPAAAATPEAPSFASLAHGAASRRRLQQAQQCPTSKGAVLVLAPFLVENECTTFGDEADAVAALYRAAGYDVTFKCNDAALCPAGPPALEDFTGWSKYAAVVVSSRGDDDAGGNSPVLLTRAPIDLDRYQLDWQAGRVVLTSDGLAALRPSWFAKYRDAAGAEPARTVVYFSSDFSAVSPPASAQDGVEEKGFAAAFWSMDGATSYAGFTGALSRSFDAPSPGVAMARHLLAGGTVESYAGTGGRDKLTGAAFRSYAYRRTSTLLDRCAFKCERVTCSPPQCALSEVVCNTLTGTCDVSCCDKKDGDACRLRGRGSTCRAGKCIDKCASALCSAPPCQELVGQDGAICNPATGACRTNNLPDGTSCSFQGGGGRCVAGACKGLVSLFYRLRGPASSFPATFDAAALTAFASGVAGSLDLPSTYPTSRISVSVLQPPQRAARAAPAEEGATARLTAELLDDPPLPLNMNFRVLGTAAKLQLGEPFGPGLTVERTDAGGNVLDSTTSNSADLCKYKVCTPADECSTASCVPATGSCASTPVNEGGACGTNGTCTAGKCVVASVEPKEEDPCAANPCSSVANAVPSSCVRTDANASLAASFRCSCETGYSWAGGKCGARCANVTCVSTECRAGSCNATAGACVFTNAADGIACTPQPSARRRRPAAGGSGVCQAGVCKDLCANVTCAPELCRVATCNAANGACTYADVAYGTPCTLGGAGGFCSFGSCTLPNPCAGVTCTPGACQTGGSCSNGVCSFGAAPNGAACTLGGGGAGVCVLSGASSVCTEVVVQRVRITSPANYTPVAVAAGASGTVYFTTRDNCVGKVLSTALSGTAGVSLATVDILADLQGEAGIQADSLAGLAVDEAGGWLYIADRSLHCVRKMSLTSSTVSTVLGQCSATNACASSVCGGSSSAPGVAASAVSLFRPSSVALAPGGAGSVLLVADAGNNCVRQHNLTSDLVVDVLGVCNGTSSVVTFPNLRRYTVGSDPSQNTWWAAITNDGTGISNIDNIGGGAYERYTGAGTSTSSGSGDLRTWARTGKLSISNPVIEVNLIASAALTGGGLAFGSDRVIASSFPSPYRENMRSHSLLVVPDPAGAPTDGTLLVPLDGGGGAGGPLDPLLTRVGGLAAVNGTLWVSDGANDNLVPGQFTLLRPDAMPAVPAYFRGGAVFAGAKHTCGVPARGAAAGSAPVCWGDGGAAVLTPPAMLLPLPPTPSLSADRARAHAQGDNSTGQLAVPSDVASIAYKYAMCAGTYHTCALVMDNSYAMRIACWGCEPGNALCDYVNNNSTVNVDLAAAAINEPGALSCGPRHLCVMSSTGGAINSGHPWYNTVVCFDGSGSSCGPQCDTPPTFTWPFSGARVMATSARHTCAASGQQIFECWPASEPAANTTDIAEQAWYPDQICVGDDFTCGLFRSTSSMSNPTRTYALRCWPDSVLALPPGLSGMAATAANVTSITCGRQHMCATKGGGATVCIGANAGAGCLDGRCNVPVADRTKWPFRPDP